ncbi:MAG: hypothetical protein PHI47_09550 [Sulfuricurvum sp.]|uniref:hypothetical protein n=1 Tax=Sulfuricurvum sp. TaxID=2025608 RepID=UPI0026168201|nr:hypothetical protein [Sulfuricurvum sp.]MDD5158651.1 hypothetical protein [Sulfuricurvum sp.]MDD5160283.1 hypothetical protein [Sulfuricurvum sp.]
MKRTQSFSLYALIIALLVHLIVILLLILLDQFKPVPPPEMKPSNPEEERFKISIKERPGIEKEAIIKSEVPKPPTKRPIPHGEQLVKQAQFSPKPVTPKAKPTQPVITPAPPVSIPVIEPKKAFERHVAQSVATIEHQTVSKKEFSLHDTLSRPDGSAANIKSTAKINDSIQQLYGDKFNELSEGEQKYILDNQEIMRRITQEVLDNFGRSKIPDNLRINDINMVEFYLYPNGSISDLRLLKNSQVSILDDTTIMTINSAYHKYPRPSQKTLIRYRVWYNLTGY